MLNPRSQPIPKWSEAVLRSGQEFGPVPLRLVEGAIPSEVRGALFRNGPARLERGGQHVGHWFDGDGAILSVRFTGAAATAAYRYVQTAGYQLERRTGKLVLANYGMTPPGPWWRRLGKGLKNTANTSVLALPDKLLALWEAGQPHALDLDTLETIGIDDLDGLNGLSYSAHPKQDWRTGDIFNFGVSLGRKAGLHLYRSDRTGSVRQQATITVRATPFIHDFVIAGRYLIICIPPVQVRLLPVLAMLQSYGDALAWRPEQGTEIIVVDRTTLEVTSQFNSDPWFQWHFGNAYERDDGSVMIEVVRYPDFQSNQRLKEIASGQTHTPAVSTLCHLLIDPIKGRVISMEEAMSRNCEFPVIDPRDAGRPSRFTYFSMHRRGANLVEDLFQTIGRFDAKTLTLTELDLGEGLYPSEPIFAADADRPENGWILTVVFDGNRDCSELWIHSADRLDDGPVCRLELPAVIPLGFHGTWKPADGPP